VFIVFILILAFASSASIQQSAEQLYQSGIYKEEVEGELEKAIEIYQTIVKQFPGNREIAAKAQLHIGLCYEKLGLKEAQKAFQKVVDNYPERQEEVAIAKERIAALS
jgi:tetratricopeptide (TPR) repeat protein